MGDARSWNTAGNGTLVSRVTVPLGVLPELWAPPPIGIHAVPVLAGLPVVYSRFRFMERACSEILMIS